MGEEEPAEKGLKRLNCGDAKLGGRPVFRNVWVRGLSMTKNFNHLLCRFVGVS